MSRFGPLNDWTRFPIDRWQSYHCEGCARWVEPSDQDTIYGRKRLVTEHVDEDAGGGMFHSWCWPDRDLEYVWEEAPRPPMNRVEPR